ncbi:hypothetical protein FCV43_14735 [Vibrio genomosp. F6]|uniref:hypothetical protein n=1 Tax=Vibrio genomosp. F6 TaxID=723172 RepID=UPI0010BE024A|nr:hypothetical protein [Vibrio genomosp. F6]TKF19960.1 hypothetical protein FCV43_14735 [Vibrio genomosp. F6]
MNSTLSIPTDNPYKLMAIIGSVIFITSLYFLGYQTYRFNDSVFESLEKISIVSSNTELSEPDKEFRISIEERKIEIIKKDRRFLPYGCALFSVIGLFLGFFGFRHWLLEIYPDETAIRKAQLKNLQLSNLERSRINIKKRT